MSPRPDRLENLTAEYRNWADLLDGLVDTAYITLNDVCGDQARAMDALRTELDDPRTATPAQLRAALAAALVRLAAFQRNGRVH